MSSTLPRDRNGFPSMLPEIPMAMLWRLYLTDQSGKLVPSVTPQPVSSQGDPATHAIAVAPFRCEQT